MNPKVSIVMPCYNVERYLAEAIESVLEQTLEEIELVCVDDGSTDRTGSIIDEMARCDKRITVIHKKNGGYGESLNVGFRAAKGDYLGIVESDDYILPGMYKTLYEVAEANDLDFVKSDFYKIWGDGKNRRLVRENTCNKSGYYCEILNPSENLDLFNMQMMNWTGLYRRAFLEKHGIVHNESPGASYQDNGFWFQSFCWAKRIMVVPKAFYCYRQDNSASSINQDNKVYAMFDEYAWIRDFLKRNPQIEERFLGVFHYKKTHNLNFILSILDKRFRGQFLSRYSEEYREAKLDGELDASLFWPVEWVELCAIMEDPGYYDVHFEEIQDALRRPPRIEKRNLKRAFLDTLHSEGANRAVRKAVRYLAKQNRKR